MDFVGRFFRLPEQSCLLFGPRGTGKSTLLRERLPDALYLDLLDPALHRSFLARPERLREMLGGSPDKRIVVIDESQRVPELLTVVHAVMEAPNAPRFVLTGSSARKLRRGGVDLLAGRARPSGSAVGWLAVSVGGRVAVARVDWNVRRGPRKTTGMCFLMVSQNLRAARIQVRHVREGRSSREADPRCASLGRYLGGPTVDAVDSTKCSP